MPTITISGNNYPSYITVADADAYLAADFQRAAAWAALDPDVKGQLLVTATRLLQRLCWAAGAAPDVDDPDLPPAVAEATALMAADIANDPALGDSAATGTNVKRAKAGSAEVEFFRSFENNPLPAAAWDLLLSTGLMCANTGAGSGEGIPVISGSGYPSRFDDCWDGFETGDPALDSY